jgi:hypothetical protein
MRNHNLQVFIGIALVAVLGAAYTWAQLSSASHGSSGGGLVGAPVDPRYGQGAEVGSLCDYGYDAARDWSRIATALSIPATIVFGLWRLDRRRDIAIASMLQNSISLETVRRYMRNGVWQAIAMAILAPLGIHLAGTFAINNYGGLCGGL